MARLRCNGQRRELVSRSFRIAGDPGFQAVDRVDELQPFGGGTRFVEPALRRQDGGQDQKRPEQVGRQEISPQMALQGPSDAYRTSGDAVFIPLDCTEQKDASGHMPHLDAAAGAAAAGAEIGAFTPGFRLFLQGRLLPFG